MKNEPVNIKDKLIKITEQWSPRIIAQLNNYYVKAVKLEGDFVWHSHPETDELFMVIDGTLRIDLRDDAVTLQAGEIFVVPKGVEHKPFAEKECHILLIEPTGTLNTGNAGGDRTAEENIWI